MFWCGSYRFALLSIGSLGRRSAFCGLLAVRREAGHCPLADPTTLGWQVVVALTLGTVIWHSGDVYSA